MLKILCALTIALSSFVLSACVSQAVIQKNSAEPVIIKSPADSRNYRSITMSNGLKVMLISDPAADRAAAALDVHVGSGHDPIDRQGLAHYLEHMLFLGTTKYPQAGEYQQYISEHGGSNNAYTTLNHTNYFFHITPDYFEGALDRFSQFFIAPLLNPEYVKRERKVVHSEYKARKNDEGRRLWKARRKAYNPDHPSTKFSVGSLGTLANEENNDVRSDLLSFYKDYYHAPRMALSVISSHSLDQLQTWVESKFNTISSEGKAYTPFESPLVNATQLPVILKLKPIKETRQLNFSFPIDSVHPYENSKPTAYLSNLLGHEGEGSLLAYLKSKSWANSLSAGLGYSDDVQATFDITIGLSKQGADHIDEIGALLFSTIRLIREQGIIPLYFDEAKQLAELDFQFQEKSEESSLVQRLASLLHRYPATEVLSTPYRFNQFEPDHIKHILAKLRPDNLQLIVVDPNLESKQQTKWYDVKYQLSPIKSDWLLNWQQAELSSNIRLPEPNPFIPDQLKLLAKTDSNDVNGPKIIKNSINVQVWHQTLLDFKQPKAELYFSLRSDNANITAQHAILTELYVKTVDEALSTFSYPAHLAGLEYRIYSHSRGLSVRISGYTEQQAALLDKIVTTLQTVELNQTKFDLYLETVRRGLENDLKARPSERVVDGIYNVLLTSSWSSQEKLDALNNIDINDLKRHTKSLLSNPDMIVLSVGNVSELESFRAGDVVSRLVSDEAINTFVSRAKIRKLNNGKWTLQPSSAAHDDAAIALIFQGTSTDIEELAATQLLGALIHTPYYQTLRTEAQVGYIVSAFAFNLLDTPALGFSVQSNNHSVSDIVARTNTFLSAYVDALAKLPDTNFEATKAGLIARLDKEEKQLKIVASRYWSEIDREVYSFDTRERLIATLKTLSKPKLSAYFEQLISNKSAAALLSYSFGDKSTQLILPNKAKSKQFHSLAKARETLNKHF